MVKFLLAFLFSLNASAALYNPQGTAPLTVLSVTSATKTPAASSQYQALSSNSIPLTVGTWELSAWAEWTNSGSAASTSYVLLGIYGSNGADSATVPTLLSATSNLTLNSSLMAVGHLITMGATSDFTRLYSGPVIVTVTATVTVYVVTNTQMTTAANCRINAGMTARKIY